MAFAEGLQPEDYGVLVRIRLRAPSLHLHVPELLAEFQECGWKITPHRLRESLRRLRKAGLLTPAPIPEPSGDVFDRAARQKDRIRDVSDDVYIRATERGLAGRAYAIRDTETQLVKIGMSKDPNRRLRDLATGTPGQLEVIWSHEGGSSLEALLHRHFADRHVRGEWFDFTGTDALILIGQVVDKHWGSAS
ncbi:GIY-YIG nuclease family protein [Streptomyces sp. NPDC023588]|uniref:GIY-YIG nuclease family protein n=1 Tax=Streptomyces sp. NPDC023588 TaxID=3154907 RepID=UPI0033D4CAE3